MEKIKKKSGGSRLGAGRHFIGNEKRITLNARVDALTMSTLCQLQSSIKISRGGALDHIVRLYLQKVPIMDI